MTDYETIKRLVQEEVQKHAPSLNGWTLDDFKEAVKSGLGDQNDNFWPSVNPTANQDRVIENLFKDK